MKHDKSSAIERDAATTFLQSKAIKAMFSALLLCVLVPLPAIGLSQVYRTVLPDGTVVFSDQASDNAEKIEVKALPIMNFPTPSYSPARSSKTDSTSSGKYSSVSISAPKHDSTVVHGGGVIAVRVSTVPNLKKGHKVQLTLNGADYGNAAGTTGFSLSAIDRGSHALAARIIDAKGKTVASSPAITLHMRRPTVN